jgi:hypothetical protein
MERFQRERSLMARRWRVEWRAHGGDFGRCPCGHGAGTMRKHRPFESHSSKTCRLCALERASARQQRRRERHGARQVIAEELALSER